MENYQQEGWVSLYQSALIELDEAKMSERIKAACEAIVARMEKLSTLPEPHPAERQAIEDALRGLRSLEQEHARVTAESERLAVENIPENLRSSDPAAQVLKDTPDPD
jgi:hypothetical protein